jgi:hypothetical protein
MPEHDSTNKTADALEIVTMTFADRRNVELFVYHGVEHGFDQMLDGTHFNRDASRLSGARVAMFLRNSLA